MSDLNIKELKIEEAREIIFENCTISLKRDGMLIYYKDGDLISSRGILRNDRFSHIKDILDKNNFPNCMGEIYIPNGNVFSVSSKENWSKCLFMPFDLISSDKYSERQKIITDKVKEMNNPFITEMIKFSNIEDGWNYVKENKEEGLVIKNDYCWFKIKILQEIKIKIVSHEAGKDKGTFILENGSRVSGTSMEFVGIYEMLKRQGKEVYSECEYAFKTEEGKLFQPRLRRIGTKEEIL